jgi:hypothetical protein
MAIRVEIAGGKLLEIGQKAWVVVSQDTISYPGFATSRWAMRQVEVRGVIENGTGLICIWGDTQRETYSPSQLYMTKEDARPDLLIRYKNARGNAQQIVRSLDILLAELEMKPMKELPNA